MNSETKRHLKKLSLRVGGLLEAAKFLVENGRSDLAELIAPFINDLHRQFDKECKEAGYKGGGEALNDILGKDV